MATTKADIEGWLVSAKEEKATHLIVVCDSFDYEDYPVYVLKGQDVRKVVESYHGKNMQRVMEVYNLSKPLKAQLAEERAYNL